MSGLNKCFFLGNLAADPESRSTSGGKSVCNFRIGVNERKDGDTLWLNVVTFDKQAENCQRFLTKGKQVLIEGRLQIRKYTAKDGTEKYSTECIANNVTFLGGGKGAVDKVRDTFGTDTETKGEPGEDDLPF